MGTMGNQSPHLQRRRKNLALLGVAPSRGEREEWQGEAGAASSGDALAGSAPAPERNGSAGGAPRQGGARQHRARRGPVHPRDAVEAGGAGAGGIVRFPGLAVFPGARLGGVRSAQAPAVRAHGVEHGRGETAQGGAEKAPGGDEGERLPRGTTAKQSPPGSEADAPQPKPAVNGEGTPAQLLPCPAGPGRGQEGHVGRAVGPRSAAGAAL